jgi:hypothetical protein
MATNPNKRKTAAEKAAETEVQEQSVEATEASVVVVEEVKVETAVEETKEPEKVAEEVKAVDVDGEVVAEFTQQLSIFGKFIYNARNEDVTLIVENLGYGDVYVSENDTVRVGDESQRLLFKEQRAIKASKLFFTSGSQPVVSIIEVK